VSYIAQISESLPVILYFLSVSLGATTANSSLSNLSGLVPTSSFLQRDHIQAIGTLRRRVFPNFKGACQPATTNLEPGLVRHINLGQNPPTQDT